MAVVAMSTQSAAVYRFSISRVSPAIRFLLVACSSVPFFPFVLAAQERLSRLDAVPTIVAMVVSTIVFIPAHEAMHGLIFWLFQRRVSYGFKLWSAFGPVFYAASIGSRFSRRQYQMACLAPQILTVLLVILAILPIPDILAVGSLYAATLNLGGGIVDIFVAARLQAFPKGALVEDTVDGMRVHMPEHEGPPGIWARAETWVRRFREKVSTSVGPKDGQQLIPWSRVRKWLRSIFP